MQTKPKFKLNDRVKLIIPVETFCSYRLKSLYGNIIEYEFRNKKQYMQTAFKPDHCYKVRFDCGTVLSWFNEEMVDFIPQIELDRIKHEQEREILKKKKEEEKKNKKMAIQQKKKEKELKKKQMEEKRKERLLLKKEKEDRKKERENKKKEIVLKKEKKDKKMKTKNKVQDKKPLKNISVKPKKNKIKNLISS